MPDLIRQLRGHRGREQDHLQHFFFRGAVAERIPDMTAQAVLVEMRHRTIDRDIDELAHLRFEMAGERRTILERQIGLQELRAQLSKP